LADALLSVEKVLKEDRLADR